MRYLLFFFCFTLMPAVWAESVPAPVKKSVKRKPVKKKHIRRASRIAPSALVSPEAPDETDEKKLEVEDPFELLNAPIVEGQEKEAEDDKEGKEKAGEDDQDEPEEPKHWVSSFLAYYGSSTGSQIGSVGATFAPLAPLEETGLRFLVQGVGGAYRYRNLQAYRSGNPNNMVNGWTRQMSAMTGYEWVEETWGLGVFLGVNWQDNSIGNAVDPNNKSIGSFWGESQGIEFHYLPTEQLMVEWNGSFSTATNAFYTTLKLGYALAEELYIGPEAYALGNNFYDQARFGGFIRGIKLDRLEFNASTGYEDRFRGQSKGVYGQISASSEF